MTKRFQALLAGISAIAIGFALIAAASRASAAGPDSAALEGMRDFGLVFTPVAVGSAEDSSVIDTADAIKAASQVMEPVDEPAVFLGLLTDTGDHEGDETTQLVTENRLVYAVRMTGLNLVSQGGRGKLDESDLHHELWSFVDSKSGEWIKSINFR